MAVPLEIVVSLKGTASAVPMPFILEAGFSR
jgi:hypothetical protein